MDLQKILRRAWSLGCHQRAVNRFVYIEMITKKKDFNFQKRDAVSAAGFGDARWTTVSAQSGTLQHSWKVQTSRAGRFLRVAKFHHSITLGGRVTVSSGRTARIAPPCDRYSRFLHDPVNMRWRASEVFRLRWNGNTAQTTRLNRDEWTLLIERRVGQTVKKSCVVSWQPLLLYCRPAVVASCWWSRRDDPYGCGCAWWRYSEITFTWFFMCLGVYLNYLKKVDFILLPVCGCIALLRKFFFMLWKFNW